MQEVIFTFKSFKAEIPNYLQSLRFKKLSVNTIRSYEYDLKHWTEALTVLLDENGEITKNDIRKATCIIGKRQIEKTTLIRKIYTLRLFTRFLYQVKKWPFDLGTNLRAPKRPLKLPKFIPETALLAAFSKSFDKDNFYEMRDQCMLQLLYGCGLRLSELRNLDIQDIQLGTGWLIVKGKGGKVRHLPLGEITMSYLRLYLKLRVYMSARRALFITIGRKRIGNRQIQIRLKKWFTDRGYFEEVNTHMLRHSFATHLLRNCCYINAIQQLLGHEKLSTTQLYTSVNITHIKTEYNKCHPKAFLKEPTRKSKVG